MSDQTPPPEAPAPSVLDRRRLMIVLAAFLIEVAIFFAGLLVPASASTRAALVNQTNNQLGGAVNGTTVELAGFIFVHNLSIAAIEMVPLLGALLFVFSIYTTGLAAQALVMAKGYPSLLGAAIFLFPYSLVELTAYAVAVASGTMLVLAWRRGRLRKELRIFAVEGVAMAAILLVAAGMEAVTIRVSSLLGFALWLPTGLAIAGLLVLAGRRRP